MVTFSVLPALAVIAPAAGALLVACTGGRRVNLREGWSFAAGAVMVGLIALMVPEVRADRLPGCTLLRLLPGIELAFKVDAFGLLFAAGRPCSGS